MRALILMTVLAQWAPREAPHYGHVRESRRMGNRSLVGQGYAFFEFAPASGAGMPAACSTTAPTGAKGETLTFTRTGNATCSKKGLATTGIADGDLVVMAGNVARVEPDSDGVLGLRVEGSRQNGALRSEEVNAAPWTTLTTGAPGTITVTPDAATAPDGTMTAERIQVPAVTAAQDTFIAQSATCTAGQPCAVTIYAKANGSACSLDICSYTGGATAQCTRTLLSTTTWTRIGKNAVAAGGNGNIFFGSAGVVATGGLGANGACDAFVWGAQAETAAYATSYIPTVAAAVTRNVELAYFTPSGLLTSPLSIAGSIYAPPTSAAAPNTAIVSVPATSLAEGVNLSLLYGNTNGLRCWNNGNYDQRAVYYGGGQERAWCAIDRESATAADRVRAEWPTGTALTDVTNGNTGSGSTAIAVRIGDFGPAGASVANGIISRVCVDPDPTRCR